MAVFLECGRKYDVNFLADHLPDLIDSTHRLATGSNKSQSKRDRNSQRATFRDIFKYVESNISPDLEVKYPDGSLKLQSWSIYMKYMAIKASMGPSIPKHLTENNFMRNALQLDDKPEFRDFFWKCDTIREQKYDNLVNDKTRTLARKYDRENKFALE